MYYKTITIWELKKMNWVKVKAETYQWIFIKWEIAVEYNKIYILHNNPSSNGGAPSDKKQYLFSWYIWWKNLDNNELSTFNNRIETLDDEFTEWEEVYCSDGGIAHALHNKEKMIYICTSSSWKHIVQLPSAYNHQSDRWFYLYKYTVKIPKEELVEEMTMEQVNKALGKKIKIIE